MNLEIYLSSSFKSMQQEPNSSLATSINGSYPGPRIESDTYLMMPKGFIRDINAGTIVWVLTKELRIRSFLM